MSMYDPPTVRGDMSTKQLANLVAELIDDMSFIINGNIDTRNVRELNAEVIVAGSITAEKMNVTELSAISANLGHIVAGDIESVTITGSRIQTRRPGIYPRIEITSTENLLIAEVNSSNRIIMSPMGVTSYPEFTFQSEGLVGSLDLSYGTFSMATFNANMYLSGNKITIEAPFGIDFFTTTYVDFNDWSKIRNKTTQKTLQQELNDIWAAIASL